FRIEKAVVTSNSKDGVPLFVLNHKSFEELEKLSPGFTAKILLISKLKIANAKAENPDFDEQLKIANAKAENPDFDEQMRHASLNASDKSVAKGTFSKIDSMVSSLKTQVLETRLKALTTTAGCERVIH
ncbi:hypothetical protein T484DRAFT_1833697, partial [Baffinella frigidus]